MKIRNGFVSNSSSASFIVTVKMDKHQLFHVLSKELGWSYLSKAAFRGIVSVALEKHKEYLRKEKKELKNKKLKEILPFDNFWEDTVKSETELLDKIDKYKINDYKYDGEEDYINFVQDVLSYHHIFLKPLFKTEDVWEFSSWTSMFNSYDDIPTLLKEIILMFAFENHEVKCIVHDGN